MTKAPVFAFMTALLLALCVGAVWPVVALFSRGDAAWMALAAGLVAACSVGLLAIETPWVRALLAAALTLVSIAYAKYLTAAAAVTAVMGLPFRVVVATIGPEMAFAIARARLTPVDRLLLLAGVALAVVGALRRTARQAQPSASPPSGP